MYYHLQTSIFLIVAGLSRIQAQIIGERCRYDSNCFVEHSYCENHISCQCKENFVPSSDLHSCVAIVGAVCETHYDCSTLDHSVCSENLCNCDRNFVPDAVGSACLPVVSRLNDECVQDNQCQERLGRFSYCTFRTCQCMPNYHYTGSSCVYSRRLEETCNNNGECYLGEEFRHVIECRAGKCLCVQNFYNDNGHCYSGGGRIGANHLLIFTFVVIIKLIFHSRY